MKHFLLTCLLLLGFSGFVFAQENIVVTGIVTDTNKEPMIGVNVSVADMPGLGAITDINGKYSLKTPPYHKIVFSYIGCRAVAVRLPPVPALRAGQPVHPDPVRSVPRGFPPPAGRPCGNSPATQLRRA